MGARDAGTHARFRLSPPCSVLSLVWREFSQFATSSTWGMHGEPQLNAVSPQRAAKCGKTRGEAATPAGNRPIERLGQKA
jgi:hypothetical protein